MSEQLILQWLHDTWLGQVTREHEWIFPTFETLHFIGLSVLMGALLIVDLRLLGLFRRIPIQSALQFTHFAVVGFAINALTGIGLITSNPVNYWTNPAFKLKMALIVLAGLNLLYFETVERKKLRVMPGDADTLPDTKIVAGLSLTLWTTILVLGRILPQFSLIG